MNTCFIFGTSVNSYIPLTPSSLHLFPEENEPVSVESWLNPPTDKNYYTGQSRAFDVNSEDGLFLVQNVALFRFLNGQKILVKSFVGVPDDLVACTLLGTPIAISFMQQGRLVLHGCCVERDGVGVIVLGQTRAGKSTLGLTFVRNGWRLVSDDVIVISFDESGMVKVVPSYPWMKVDKAAAKATSLDEARLGHLPDGITKKKLSLYSDEFVASPVPIRCILFPKFGSKTELKAVSPANALMGVVPNAHGPAPRTKFPQETKEHFKQMSRLVEQVDCYDFYRPLDLSGVKGQAKFLGERIFSM